MKTALRLAASLITLAFCASQPAFAAEGTRKEVRREDLSGAPGMEVVLSITEVKPGEEIPTHFHHGIEAGYVLEGGTAQNTAGAQITMETGAPIFNLRDAKHGGFKVTGTKTLKFVTVHVVDKGKPLFDKSAK
jgi:quercetin dioxygenase-like cupin family protein